jgi:hypothetical protein
MGRNSGALIGGEPCELVQWLLLLKVVLFGLAVLKGYADLAPFGPFSSEFS